MSRPPRRAAAIIAVASCALAIPRLGSARAHESGDAFAADTAAYLGRLDKLGFDGVVLVARGGAPILAEGFGLADRERGMPWSPGVVACIGSITKQFTAAAILLLEQEGRLSVSDPITKHFADVPPDKQSITLHQLLTHSSGIADLDGAGDWDPIGRDEFVRRALAQSLAFAPGEGYAYSNAGYSLLAAIIELITGGAYEQFVRERLFLPQGMYETGYALAGWGDGRLAQGYAGAERWGTTLERPMDADGPYWVLRGNGGIHSTAFDMLRWAEALRAGRVLAPASLEKLWAPHVSEGGDTHYGYGWSIVTVPPDLKVITHNGGNGINFADLAIIPAAETVIFLQANVLGDFPLAENLLEQVGRRLLMGMPYPEVPDPTEVAAETLAPLAGDYRLDEGDEGLLRVTADGSSLLLEADGAGAFAALHSTRPVDRDRCDRFNARIDAIVAAWRAGDLEPMHEAYAGRVSLERLTSRAEETLGEWQQARGPLRGHEVLGSAMRPGRDVTVVRFTFERGHEDRAYVWDVEADERLLGYSVQGVDARLRFYPVAGGAFASWDRATGASAPLRFDPAPGTPRRLSLGAGDLAVAAQRN